MVGFRDVTGGNFIGYNRGLNPLVKYNYFLRVEALFDIPLKRVQAFTRDLEYEFIQEGGLNDYVHIRRKPKSKPNTLVIERYAGTYLLDPLPNGAELFLPLILLVFRDTWVPARTYTFTGCTVIRKTYGELAAEDSGLLVDEIEIAYREFMILDIGLDIPIGKNYEDNAKPSTHSIRIGRDTENLKDESSEDGADTKFVIPSGTASAVTALQATQERVLQPLYAARYSEKKASVNAIKEEQTQKQATAKEYKNTLFTTATSDGVKQKQNLDKAQAKRYVTKSGNTVTEIREAQIKAYKYLVDEKKKYTSVTGNTVEELKQAQAEKAKAAKVYLLKKGNTVKEVTLQQQGLRFTDRRYTDAAVATVGKVMEQQEKQDKARKKYVLVKGNTVNERIGAQVVEQAKAKKYSESKGNTVKEIAEQQKAAKPEALGRVSGNTAAELRTAQGQLKAESLGRVSGNTAAELRAAQAQAQPAHLGRADGNTAGEIREAQGKQVFKSYTVHASSVDAIRQKQEDLKKAVKKYDQYV